MRASDIIPTGLSTLKRARPVDESSAARDSSKMPRVEQNIAAQRESHVPQYMLTPPEDIAHQPSESAAPLPVPTPNKSNESSVLMPEVFPKSVEDSLSFLNILLSTGMELDPLAAMSITGDEPNTLDIPPGTE